MLKQSLQDRIVNPVARGNWVAVSTAVVKTADEKNNLCSIKYVDKDGRMGNKDNVEVRLTGTDSWFPKIGDRVTIEDRGSMVVILGPAVKNYSSEEREKNKPTRDIHPEPSSSIGGCVF